MAPLHDISVCRRPDIFSQCSPAHKNHIVRPRRMLKGRIMLMNIHSPRRSISFSEKQMVTLLGVNPISCVPACPDKISIRWGKNGSPWRLYKRHQLSTREMAR